MRLLQPIGECVNILRRCVPHSVENRAALRTALAVLVTALVAFQLHMSTPYWAGMTVVILSNLYTGSIIDKAILRMFGTIIGAFIGYYVAGIVVNSFYLYLLMCFLLVMIAMYYYTISRYAYAYLLGGITTFLIISQLSINPANAFYVAIWRSAEICLGVAVSAISAFCFFPNNIKDNYLKHVDLIFTLFSKEIEQLQYYLCEGALSLDAIAETNLELKKELKQTSEMIGLMRHEAGINRSVIDKSHALLDVLYGLARRLNYFIISQQAGPTKDFARKNQLPIDDVFKAMLIDLATLKDAFETHDGKKYPLHTTEAFNVLNETFTEHRKLSAADLKLYYPVQHLLQQVSESMVSLGTLLIDQQHVVTTKVKVHSRIVRLQNDPDVIKHSIKVGCSVLLALLIWLLSSWPGGLNGIVSSIVISIRKNIFEMKNISAHRMLGCLIGGGSALFILAVIPLEIYSLMITLFLLVWAFSYFSFKYTKYSYIGLQANIALIITLAQEGGPPIYLDPPLERLGGIVIGIFASFIVANLLWRTDTFSMLKGRLHKLSRFIKYNIQQVLILDTEQVILHDVTNLFWVCRGLLESIGNERLNAKKQLEYETLKNTFEKLVLIQATIRYLYESTNRTEIHATAAALNIDLNTCETSIEGLYREALKEDAGIIQKLDYYLMQVDKDTTHSGVSNEQVINLLAYLGALRQLAQG